MEAIRINQTLDSDTLHLPQLRPLIGKPVEITVREDVSANAGNGKGRDVSRNAWEAALQDLSGLDVDWDAYRRQRELDLHRADDHAL